MTGQPHCRNRTVALETAKAMRSPGNDTPAPGNALTDEERADLSRWIAAGMPDHPLYVPRTM